MKRHYEVIRIMRTKIVDPRELDQCVDSILFVEDAIRYRVKSLTSMLAMLRSAGGRTDLIIPRRQLFSAEAGHSEAIRELCPRDCDDFFPNPH